MGDDVLASPLRRLLANLVDLLFLIVAVAPGAVTMVDYPTRGETLLNIGWVGTAVLQWSLICQTGQTFDDDVVELRVRASNGRFAGEAHGYASPRVGADLAAALRGFPATSEDRRSFELGTFDDRFAGGGARFELGCTDSAGHAFLLVRLRTDPKRDGRATAEFSIAVEAGAIDLFVHDLERLDSDRSITAALRGA